MVTTRDICEFLESLAPLELAEDWDNVGLLVGRRDQDVRKVMTTLTVTPESVSEAVKEEVDLIVAHHPLPFRPLARLTDDTVPGRLLLDLIGRRIAVYSPHTAFDSAADGINQQLANRLQLTETKPLVPCADHPSGLGSGRYGKLIHASQLGHVANCVRSILLLGHLRMVGDPTRLISLVAVACGSGGQLLDAAHGNECDLLLTGETNFHTCLEAQAIGVALLLTGHYASERFAVEVLARKIAEKFCDIQVWASRHESDPLQWV